MIIGFTCHARIGETLEQCEKRYGVAKEIDKNNYYKIFKYNKNNMNITIFFTNNKADCIIYQRKDTAPLKAKILYSLLEVNIPDSTGMTLMMLKRCTPCGIGDKILFCKHSKERTTHHKEGEFKITFVKNNGAIMILTQKFNELMKKRTREEELNGL